MPYTSLHYSIIVEGSANKVDNIIQVGMKSLKKKPESDNSLSIPLSPAPLHSTVSTQVLLDFSQADKLKYTFCVLLIGLLTY